MVNSSPARKARQLGESVQIAASNATSPLEAENTDSKGYIRAKAKSNKRKESRTQAQKSPESKRYLESLPPEILDLVLNNIKDSQNTSALGRTSKAFYHVMMPRLYRRVDAKGVWCRAHISRLIRTLEPHLTIAQKRQLRRECNQQGQEERYAVELDEQARPIYASYVRQLVTGVARPGPNHLHIVNRYVEEAFQNLNNLEMVEIRLLTK
jgi:hypothetical protein